jgi:DNA-binding NarL/FixJ family response regulator
VADDRIRVLLVDDEPLVRSGLAMLLDAHVDIDVVGEAGDGDAAVEAALSLRPTVVVMDVRMPGTDGVEATRRILADPAVERSSEVLGILMLTTFHDDEAVYAALREGASGFLLKSAASGDLIQAVRALARGQGWLDPAVTRRLLEEFAGRPRTGLPTPGEMAALTGREVEVLRLVAHGLSNTQIAGVLVISEATVKTHVGRILVKLGLRDRAQAVAAAYQTGLVLPTDRPAASR